MLLVSIWAPAIATGQQDARACKHSQVKVFGGSSSRTSGLGLEASF